MVKYHFIKLKRLISLTKIYFSFIDPMPGDGTKHCVTGP